MATLAPMQMGDSPLDQWTLQKTSGKPALLTGLASGNFALVLRDLSKQADRAGTGTFSIVDPVNGIVQYQWTTADTTWATTTTNVVQTKAYIRITDNAGRVNTYGPNIQQFVAS